MIKASFLNCKPSRLYRSPELNMSESDVAQNPLFLSLSPPLPLSPLFIPLSLSWSSPCRRQWSVFMLWRRSVPLKMTTASYVCSSPCLVSPTTLSSRHDTFLYLWHTISSYNNIYDYCYMASDLMIRTVILAQWLILRLTFKKVW